MKLRNIISLLAIILVPTTALPQSGGTYVIQKSVIAGGGDTSSGGSYILDGTIGEAVAGPTSSGGTFRLGAGFWGPVSAGFTVGGRVLQSSTRGITNARVTISGGPLVTPRTVPTTRHGAFQFDNVESGYTYTVTVASRRFTFSPPSQTVSVTDNVTGIVFTSTP